MEPDMTEMDANRAERIRRTKANVDTSRTSQRGRVEAWKGQQAAIYCRISHVKDEDQTGVERQERICRDVADRLGLVIPPELVFVDNNRSAWKRDRIRKGWNALLVAARKGDVRHILTYHPDRLMRQPKDLEELLTISDDADITLHGQANRRELADPDDRFFLRIEVAHACRSSDDASRRLKDVMVERAQEGIPHTGMPRYGYASGGLVPDPEQEKIVKEIFAEYLDGKSPQTIAHSLNARNVPSLTAGKRWAAWRVLAVLDNRHVAGIRVFRQKEIGKGTWPAIIDEGTWNEVRERRTFRADAHIAKQTPKTNTKRYYLLRGLVFCGTCEIRMTGAGSRSPAYGCNRGDRADDLRCSRRIGSNRLEEFVTEAALRQLETLTIHQGAPQAMMSEADQKARKKADQELAVAKTMWKAEEIDINEYREMKRTIMQRVSHVKARPAVRPTAAILKDITGPNARPAWQEMTDTGQHERQNAILRFLYAAVRIGPSITPGQFDYSRIEIEPNPL